MPDDEAVQTIDDPQETALDQSVTRSSFIPCRAKLAATVPSDFIAAISSLAAASANGLPLGTAIAVSAGGNPRP
jgi:hypothetical protein